MPPDRDGKRARILEAAYAVCRDHGVEAARMEEVAARAQVSKGTLYRYFESREHLLLATILDSYEQSLPMLPTAGAGDPRERLAQHVDVLVRVLEAVMPRMHVHYQAWGLVANTPELQERLYGFLRDFHVDRGHELAEGTVVMPVRSEGALISSMNSEKSSAVTVVNDSSSRSYNPKTRRW